MHREDEPDIDFIKNELDPEEHHKNDVIDEFLKGITPLVRVPKFRQLENRVIY